MNERAAIGGGGGGVNVDLAYKIASEVMIDGKTATQDSAVERVSELVCAESRPKFTGYRSMTALSKGTTRT